MTIRGAIRRVTPPTALATALSIRSEARRRRAIRRGRRRLARLRGLDGLLLDVGASSAHLDGWTSLDIEPDEDSVYLDAARPWPLADCCARAVRAEHMIEHLTWREALVCVREMHRVLEPGGVCRICTPDLEGIAHAYLERDPAVLDEHRRHGYEAPTWAHLPNNYLRLWGHRFMFDFDSIRSLLQEAGFVDVERTSFGISKHAVLDGTDTHDPGILGSLVVCVDARRSSGGR